MTQTAVDWLLEELGAYLPLSIKEVQLMVEQAKEIEKEHIVEAHGNQTKKSRGISNYTYILTGEQYYNEKFKK
jgi:hypothetical protein